MTTSSPRGLHYGGMSYSALAGAHALHTYGPYYGETYRLIPLYFALGARFDQLCADTSMSDAIAAFQTDPRVQTIIAQNNSNATELREFMVALGLATVIGTTFTPTTSYTREWSPWS